MRYRVQVAALLSFGLLVGAVNAKTDSTPTHEFFGVHLGDASKQAISGRLLLFAVDAKAAEAEVSKASGGKSSKVEEVDANPFGGAQASVAAREVTDWMPGTSVDIDADELHYPAAFSKLPPGYYDVQAVLDVNHDYNYLGRGAGDLVSAVVRIHLPSSTVPTLTLSRMLPADGDPWALPKSAPEPMRQAAAAARQHATSIDFTSPSLTAFWGRATVMHGWVLTPPDYKTNGSVRYPTVYFTHGYGGNQNRLLRSLISTYASMASGETPPMIYVLLDESSPTGTHEFADSVNNGPWGHALTTELIPELESKYAMDARPSGRFLTGHSSGGWATLWLQTRYPKVFGGTWSTSPDPSDFHDFTGVDLYAPNANVYYRADGSQYPLVRDKGKVISTFKHFAKLERVLGSYGGQLASFEWVFSPRGEDGRPEPMFNRTTGAVAPQMVTYWRDHYDISYRLQQHWPELKADLDGKIHVYVGTADTFYLDGAAHKLKAVLDGLGAKSEFRFMPDRTHFDIYVQGDDRQGLSKEIAWDMYAVARPDSKLKRPAAVGSAK